MNRTLRLSAASLALILLAACGAKGPLFLPPQAPPVEPVEPVEPAADAPAGTGDAAATPPADSDAPPADSSTPPVTPPAETSTGTP